MEKALISVIIPIYGVEEYLNQCIQSVVSQTYQNLEIILVDDGSQDACPRMCDMWAKKDTRIVVIHKENGGLSDARNAGMKVAIGQYIAFVDSDDWIEKEMYENMMNVLQNQNADIVECGTSYILNSKIIRRTGIPEMRLYSRKECMKELLSENAFHQTVWNKLYKKECIGKIKFEVGKYNEDEFWTYRVFNNIEKAVSLPECYYQYRQRNDSIMGNFNIKRLDALEARYKRLQFIEKQYPEYLLQEKVNFVFLCIYFYQVILKNKNLENTLAGRKEIKLYRKNITFTYQERKLLTKKERIYIAFSKCSLKLCSEIRNLLNVGID